MVDHFLRLPAARREACVAAGSDLIVSLLKSGNAISDIQLRSDSHVRLHSVQGIHIHPGTDRLSPIEIFGVLIALHRSRGGARDLAHGAQEDEDLRFLTRLAAERKQDFACEGGDLLTSVLPSGRMRVQAFFDMGGIGLTMRILRDSISSLEDLAFGASAVEALQEMAVKRSGIGIVTGITGSGKSTTLASLLDWVRRNHSRHIVTIEEPIEYRFSDTGEDGQPFGSLITQQEVGTHIDSFRQGLVDSLRKRPDIIMIGEIRDGKTMETAMEAAQTGHLVLTTLHTRGASATVARILDFFPTERAQAVLSQLAEVVLFILSQGLLPCAGADSRRVLCYELMKNSCDQSKSAIRKYHTNPTSLEEWVGREGNVAWDDYLTRLMNRGLVTREVAAANRQREVAQP